MHHHHTAGAGHAEPAVPRSVRRVLIAVVVALLLTASTGVAATWPRSVPTADTGYVGGQTVQGQVVSTEMHTCRGEVAEERLPDGNLPATVECPDVTVALQGNESTTFVVPAAVFHAGLGAGDRVLVTRYPAEVAGTESYV